jgi:phosphatidylserine/phosphatidylglycerophosphate/cardiolipin synthase-like enzyme
LTRLIRLALTLSVLARLAAPQGANAPSYTLVTEPDQGLATLYNLVNSAKHTIDMTMYELDDTTFEQYLANQAAAGVAVRVVLDKNLEQSNNQAAYTFLNANGVQAHWASPSYAATHQKTITIDANYGTARTAIMTLNLTPRYYPTTRDFAIVEDDPNDIAAIETTFQADFNGAPIAPPPGHDLVWSPTNSQTAMVGVINSAQHTLLVENEEMSDTAIVDALVGAARRGVNVQAIMNAGASYTGEWNRIVAAGGDVSTYASTAPLYIHAKAILADYGYPTGSVFVGSENFSSASLTRNRELGLIFDDIPVMSSLFATMTRDFSGGIPYTGSPALPGFTLSASPSSLNIPVGNSGTSTITSTVSGGFSGTIALSASGLPSGVSATFSPAGIAGAGSATLTLTASGTAALGASTVTVTGSSGGLTQTATVTPTIDSQPRRPTHRRQP